MSSPDKSSKESSNVTSPECAQHAQDSSSIDCVIRAKEKDLGDGFIVRRSLPHVQRRMVGPFIFWDHMGPVDIGPKEDGSLREMSVRSHPHIGLSTITYLFSGEIWHRDSLGNELPIRPGEVNWMTAGRGITHSERSSSPKELRRLEGIQLWLALPKEHEDIEASFVHKKESELPILQQDSCQLRLVAGEYEGKKSPLPVYSSLFYLAGEGSSKGGPLTHTFAKNEEAAVYIVSGKVSIEGQIYDPGSLVVLKNGASLKMKLGADARFMIFGGEALPEPRHIWWNFVSSSKERIAQAKADWKDGRFPKTIHEEERIPLPDS